MESAGCLDVAADWFRNSVTRLVTAIGARVRTCAGGWLSWAENEVTVLDSRTRFSSPYLVSGM